MKKLLCATAAIMYLAAASAAFAAPGDAAGDNADTMSSGTSTAVGLGAVGALLGVALIASDGDSSNTGTTTTTTTSTTR
ncbi:exopolysaccharide production protein YjbE [Winslowiella iniecta]|uniref:Membrane protein n=1 Tax=Winslowiella iniecta TaxID=1560201 RepID=A0A0L7T4C3_9GAMM|nr:exopolysaccharide production protein YjbE [Winslowiella iniecta]KOC87864.1 membrane protein [Winslowiella iniecta]KOC90232.1 membrane protein [Winslowiella iniecta]